MKKYLIRHHHLKEIIELQSETARKDNKHTRQIVKLLNRLSEVAIGKSEIQINERMESSNNKFGLLKEQATEFATKKEIENLDSKIAGISKLVYMGLGMIIVLELALNYLK